MVTGSFWPAARRQRVWTRADLRTGYTRSYKSSDIIAAGRGWGLWRRSLRSCDEKVGSRSAGGWLPVEL